ncbi:MAG: Gfo/Idh/MocA family oxidoreductase [Planctomycetota bacterium]|nr:Gfo/Idh/MocA family oxidoreductase [Planctomycetota bacterium]MDA1214320.1 Gfo/Idh/MocA family oxidoreductase [Planctomycetota bacterium]
MAHFTRRQFLGTSLTASGAMLTLGPRPSFGKVLGANDRVRVAIAGLHGRGRAHMAELAKMKDVEIVYLIDPDERTYAEAVKYVKDIAGNTPQTVKDVKTVLDDDSIDAITVATPNHWHSLMTIWACQAGKDVYVEKPCSHNVHEGRIAVETARKYDRIVQHGTQSRSDNRWARITAAARSGTYGPLRVARGLCYKRRGSIGFKKPATPPAELDFNLWLGPAPDQPYHENLVHYNWHWFWDTGNGDIGNQGVHQFDIARWGIKDGTLPTKVISLGGRFGYEDQGETANTQLTICDFGETKLIFEVRGLVASNTITDMFHFDDGTIRDDGKFYKKGSDTGEPIVDVDYHMGPGDGNFGNFIAAVKSRKKEDLNAEILEGHYSSALGHLANVSYRLGKQVPFNKNTEIFGNDEAASETMAAMLDHLRTENNLQLDDMNYQLGRLLTIDPVTETCIDDDEANQLLTREYRNGFEVPTEVV